MTQLADTRPHVFRELQIDPRTQADPDGPYASLVGRLVGELLDTWPDIDLPTIRIGHHTYDGRTTIRVDARRGQLAGVECPQCHQPARRPHTDYCTLAPERIWTDPLTPVRPLCPCQYTAGPVQHHITCPDWDPEDL